MIKRKFLSIILSLVLLIQLLPAGALAKNQETFDQLECKHLHDKTCGYIESDDTTEVLGEPCAHVHDETCTSFGLSQQPIETPPPEVSEDDVVSVNGVGYQDIESAMQAVTDGCTVTLLKDVTMEAPIIIEAELAFTIDLNKNTIDCPISELLDFQIDTEAAKVTIKNGTIINAECLTDDLPVGATIIIESGDYGFNASIVKSLYGTFIAKDGNFTFGQNGSFINYTDTTGCVIVYNGMFDASNGKYGFDSLYGKVTIYDGTFASQDDLFYMNSQGSQLTVHGGTFTTVGEATSLFDIDSGCQVVIYGGTFSSENTGNSLIDNNGGLSIYNGTFYASDVVLENYGTTTIKSAHFLSKLLYSGCMINDMGTITVEEGYWCEPSRDEWEGAKTIRFSPAEITVSFYIDNELYHTVTDAISKLVLPESPTSPNGAAFVFWQTAEGQVVEDLTTLREDTVLYAVFSDREFTITFHNRDTVTTNHALVGTQFGQLSDFKVDAEDFVKWVTADTRLQIGAEDVVTKDYVLDAVYAKSVDTYDKLVEAINEKQPNILIQNDLEILDSVVIDYDCTILSDDKAALIRREGFQGALIETRAGVAFDEATPASPVVTLDTLLVDGQNFEAERAAVVVGENTTLIVKNTTIQNNNNITTGWGPQDFGGGIYNRGIVKLYDGTRIQGNMAEKGGGIYNEAPQTSYETGYQAIYPVILYMYGGEISGNTATDNSTSCNAAGGGVSLNDTYDAQAKFHMYGGKITNNQAPNGCGGGVSLCCGDQSVVDTRQEEANIVFTMYGGEITDNTAGESGGGVWIGCSSMAMKNGLISRNTAKESGGGLGACCGCELNFHMTGGNITLNAATTGGGIGYEVGGIILADNIYDNLAEDAGDDVIFDSPDSMKLQNRLKARPYGQSYGSERELSDEMQALIQGAQATLNAELIPNAPEPKGVMLPFYGWYVDGEVIRWGNGNNVPRYSGLNGGKWTQEPQILEWYDGSDGMADNTGSAVKAVWYGALVLYDANNNTGETKYDPKAYLPNTSVVTLGNQFTYPGHRFVGWNTKANGTGQWYYPGREGADGFTITGSQRLYAQWQNMPQLTVTPAYMVDYVVLQEDGVTPADGQQFPNITLSASGFLPGDGLGDGSDGTYLQQLRNFYRFYRLYQAGDSLPDGTKVTADMYNYSNTVDVALNSTTKTVMGYLNGQPIQGDIDSPQKMNAVYVIKAMAGAGISGNINCEETAQVGQYNAILKDGILETRPTVNQKTTPQLTADPLTSPPVVPPENPTVFIPPTTKIINSTGMEISDTSGVKMIQSDLLDDFVTESSYMASKKALNQGVENALPAGTSYKMEYTRLAIVDANDGNHKLTTEEGQYLQVLIPYPQGTDKDYAQQFVIVHLPENQSDLSNPFDYDLEHPNVYTENAENPMYRITRTTAGLVIAVDNFSPFAIAHSLRGGGSLDEDNELAEPSSAAVVLRASKTLDGVAPTDNNFTFLLKDTEGNILQTKHNNGGEITFNTLAFSQTGTYIYTLTEKAGENSTIQYDTAIYKVIVTVEKLGNYRATVTYEKNGQPYAGVPVFTNTTKSVGDDTESSGATDSGSVDMPIRPADKVPQTGDTSKSERWLLLMAMSLMGMVIAGAAGKKRPTDNPYQ